MKQNLANLIKVKTIISLIVVIAFIVLAFMDKISGDAVKDITLMVIAFYFGTQAEKKTYENPVTTAAISDKANMAKTYSDTVDTDELELKSVVLKVGKNE